MYRTAQGYSIPKLFLAQALQTESGLEIKVDGLLATNDIIVCNL